MDETSSDVDNSLNSTHENAESSFNTSGEIEEVVEQDADYDYQDKNVDSDVEYAGIDEAVAEVSETNIEEEREGDYVTEDSHNAVQLVDSENVEEVVFDTNEEVLEPEAMEEGNPDEDFEEEQNYDNSIEKENTSAYYAQEEETEEFHEGAEPVTDSAIDTSFEEVKYEESDNVLQEEDILHDSGDVGEEIVDQDIIEEVYGSAEEEAYEEDIVSEEMVQEDNEEDLQQEVVEDSSEIIQQNVLDISENLDQDEDEDVAYGGDDNDNDYEDVVEVEEVKQNEDMEDENVAQHESESENEQDDDGDREEEEFKLGHVSDDDVRESENEAENDDPEPSRKSESDNVKDESKNQDAIAKMFDSDSDEEEGAAGGEKEGVGNLIADIFGESDDEDEEFEGFGEDEVGKSKASASKPLSAVISDSDEDQGDASPAADTAPQEESSSDEGVRESQKEGMISDFDVMMQKKKEERRGRRRRDGGTFISDADDIINAMLTKMKEAADADREANRLKKPAINKLKMLPIVVRHLKKQDLKEAFVDMGIISAIADWLTLLPDKSLPHVSIRTEMLGILHDLPSVSPETLKTSGIGRAVMILFKHPRETRKIKESAGRLINKWSRPIFGLNENFKSMSRGEREQRDLDQMPQSKRRRLSSGRNESEHPTDGTPEPGQLRPGERGFVMRARVPMPSNKDYVVRPKWNVETGDDDDGRNHFNKRSNKPRKDERLEKHLKTFAERRKNSKMQRAVGISLEGNKMPLS
ncbi:uncharacterized protein LOC143460502 isoform X1 [Clavelina lepadiformis]|uniref:uncharacterized protein LOC143460502 isoform X1 n=1 Tax=Clavelina lepadiformis TaxID=159417 RepID=UPI00404216E4